MKNHDPATPTMRPSWRKGLMALFYSTGLLGAAHAQLTADHYSFSTTTGISLDPMTGAASLMVGPGDDWNPALDQAVGFPFTFEGVAYTTYSVNQNGIIRLGPGGITGGTMDNIDNPNSPPKFFVYGAESSFPAGATVTTVLNGVEPNRIRVVQWHNGYLWNSPSPTNTFQLWLHEGSNTIEFRYGVGLAPANYNTVGIGGANPWQYLNVRPGHVASTTDGGNLNQWPGDGRSYTFAPPAPCTTPTPGSTLAGGTNGCTGFFTTISLQNGTPGTGVSYQWQSSPDGSSWNDIGGATSATYNTGSLSATTWYQCKVTCITGPSTVNSTPVEITISDPAPTYYVYSGTQYTEDFTGWANRCSTNDVPDGGSYWRNSPAYGPGTWRASNTGFGAQGWNNTSGQFTATAVASNPNAFAITYPTARFHSREGGSVVGTLDFYVDMSAATGTEKLRFEYINSVGSGNLGVWVSTNGGSSFAQVGSTLIATNANGGTTNTWYLQEFTIGSTSATTVIRLRGTAAPGASGNDIGVDNFRIIPAATCIAPTAPSAAVTGPGSVDIGFACSGCTGSYYVEYGPPSFTLGSGTVAGPFAGSPATISGLASGSYKAYVRQDCGDDDISENVGPVNFSIVDGDFCTNAIDMTTLPLTNWSLMGSNAGSNHNYSTSCASYAGGDVVLYHDVEVGATISFTMEAANSVLSIGYGGSCPGTNVLACGTGGYYLDLGPNVVDVDFYNTFTWTNDGCQTERLYLLAGAKLSNGGGGIYIANFAYTTPGGPVCNAVTGVAVSTVNTGTGANVSWGATCSGNVLVEYGAQGFTPGTGTSVPVSGTSTTLGGLTLDAGYDVYVRQDCGGGLYSAYGSPVSFTVRNGDDCSRVIALSDESGSILLNTAGANNDISACTGGNVGGDLALSFNVPAGYGIYLTSAPVSPYVGHVAISTGVACPGSTVLYCNTGAADYFWLNETGSSATVYFIQDGTDNGSATVEWSLFAECALYDSDNDGINDCDDTCPEYPGQQGDPCDDGDDDTENDVVTAGCACAGTPVAPCTTDLTLEFRSDAPGQTTWEIRDANTNAILRSGGPLNGSPETNMTCLPDGCYVLRVLDSGGDGMVGGGYVLRTSGPNGDRIIDNSGNFSTGFVSQASQGFCLPLGGDQLIYSSCDKLEWVNNKFIVVAENPAVSAQFGVSNANSGYEFWFFDPNGGYSFRRFRSHSTSDGYGTGALRANHFKVNGWVNSGSVPHIPANRLLNVRVRGRVAGVNQEFGPACQFKIDAALAACPRVKLQDDPANTADFSCGVVRSFGGSSNANNRITANPPQPVPTVASSNVRYQFRFRIPGEGICIVRPAQTSARLVLNWTNGTALQAGKTYEVDVRVSLNGGSTWCFGPSGSSQSAACADTEDWGKVCLVTISGGQAQGGSSSLAVAGSDANLTMYPNPNRGDQLFVSLSRVEDGVSTVSIDIFDLTGKKVTARTIAVQDGFVNTALDLNGEIANGVYLVNITAGRKAYTERLVIQH